MNKLVKSLTIKIGAIIKNNRNSKIFYYHDVYHDNKYTNMGTPLSLFDKQIQLIKNEKFKIVDQITQKENEIMLCFDDGFRGIWDNREYFIKNQIKPTIFIAVELIGKTGYLKENEILELASNGFIFQSHSYSHKSLTQLSSCEIRNELYNSKTELSKLLNKNVNEICFPLGHYSDEVQNISIEVGYKKLYTCIPGNYHDNIGKMLITRNIVQYSSIFEIKSILYGGLQMLKKRYLNRHYKCT